MKRSLVVALVLLAAGCAQAPGPNGTPTTTGTGAVGDGATVPTGSPVQPTNGPTAAKATTAAPVTWKVTYHWNVPSGPVTVPHPLKPPITTPLGTPLPYLEGVYVGDHPSERPGYSRVSFYFRGAFPEYTVRYAREVVTDGEGRKLPLAGNAALEIRFWQAQAHDNAGRTTIKAKPPTTIGYRNLKDYGFAGDYEGYVTYGFGLQVAPNSDQVLALRLGELTKSDSVGTIYVVALDIQHG
jgi:hypothetical protein